MQLRGATTKSFKCILFHNNVLTIVIRRSVVFENAVKSVGDRFVQPQHTPSAV